MDVWDQVFDGKAKDQIVLGNIETCSKIISECVKMCAQMDVDFVNQLDLMSKCKSSLNHSSCFTRTPLICHEAISP